MTSISILLASYNGEKYIAEQIDSLLVQTVQDFKLFICDDKSTDNTFGIISSYAKKYPKKICAYQNEKNTGNAKHNFIKMMVKYNDDYVMLCDQDDVWLPDKIEKTLARMRELEEIYGKIEPIVVHTDLKVVDKNLNVISPSYAKMSRTDYEKKALHHLRTRNIAAGCTQMYNRALCDLISAKPEFIMVHDWWATLTASALGKISTVYEPTILYRQHDSNSIGAKKAFSVAHIYCRLMNFRKVVDSVNDTYRQAKSFLDFYSAQLSDEQQKLLSAYASIPALSKMERLRVLARHNVFMYGFIRKSVQIFIVLMY